MTEDLPPKSATVKVPGVEVVVDKNDSWETVGMILVLVLGVYAGIKAINRLFDSRKRKNSLWE